MVNNKNRGKGQRGRTQNRSQAATNQAVRAVTRNLGQRLGTAVAKKVAGQVIPRTSGPTSNMYTSSGERIYGPVSRLADRPSHVVGNRRELAKESHLPSPAKLLGETQDGRDWAMAALHPCGAAAPMSVGLPDTITAAVVTPNYRFEKEIAFDSGIFATAPVGTTVWSAQIVVLPVPEISYMYALRADTATSGSGVWSHWVVVRTPGFELPSATTWDADTVGTTFSSVGYSRYRTVGRGITFELNASALNNQGRVISGQYNAQVQTNSVAILAPSTVPGSTTGGLLTGPSENDPARTVHNFEIVADEQMLVSACPRVYQEEAVNGAYIIHKFDGPLLGYQFARTGDDESYGIPAATSISPSINGPYSALRLAQGTDENFVTFTSGSESNRYSGHLGASNDLDEMNHPFVSAPSDMLTSHTFFIGLPLTSSAPSPTIRVKGRTFHECQSNGSAAVAPFVHPPPLRDMVAIDRVVAVMQQYDDAYPSSYNGWGDIVGTIWSSLKNIGSTVSNVWNNVVKPIGDTIETGVGLAALF